MLSTVWVFGNSLAPKCSPGRPSISQALSEAQPESWKTRRHRDRLSRRRHRHRRLRLRSLTGGGAKQKAKVSRARLPVFSLFFCQNTNRRGRRWKLEQFLDARNAAIDFAPLEKLDFVVATGERLFFFHHGLLLISLLQTVKLSLLGGTQVFGEVLKTQDAQPKLTSQRKPRTGLERSL